MTERNIVAILVDHRQESAEKVQKILTGWGCMIRTRLGLHEGVLDNCSQSGLLLLEMVGEKEKIEDFVHKVNLVKGACAKLVSLSVE